MWWEKFLLWAVILEKSVLYPLIFLSAVYQDKGVFSDLFGLWGGSMLMSICLLKSLRLVFWGEILKDFKVNNIVNFAHAHCSLFSSCSIFSFYNICIVFYSSCFNVRLAIVIVIVRGVCYLEKLRLFEEKNSPPEGFMGLFSNFKKVNNVLGKKYRKRFKKLAFWILMSIFFIFFQIIKNSWNYISLIIELLNC